MTRALILGRHCLLAAFLLAASAVALLVWTIGDTLTASSQPAIPFAASPATTPLQASKQAAPAGVSSQASAAAAAIQLPDVTIETSQGARTSFAATGGRVRIATMFYAHCPGLCPLTIETVQSLERQLTAPERTRLNVLMLSLDPARDSPAALRALSSERRIDSNRWVVGRTSAEDARTFANALGIQYRTLDDGSIDHTSMLALIDANGRVLARNSDTGAPDVQFVDAVRRALASR